VPHLLLATDADWIRDDIDAALTDPDTTVSRVRKGSEVLDAIRAVQPELVILDLQIGNMGGIAACLHLHHEAGAGRLPAVPVMMLLDRQADVFLARRSGANGWVVKPLDAYSLRKVATAILEGERGAAAERALVGDVNPA
jgi:DNA-binding response OmpR family regulator